MWLRRGLKAGAINFNTEISHWPADQHPQQLVEELEEVRPQGGKCILITSNNIIRGILLPALFPLPGCPVLLFRYLWVLMTARAYYGMMGK